MKLKKAKRPKPIVARPYHIRFGTPNELGPERTFQTHNMAVKAMADGFREWLPWCERHNQAGTKEIKSTIDSLGEITFHRTPERVLCTFDELYGLTLAAEYWSTDV